MQKHLSGKLDLGTVANEKYSISAHDIASEIESVTQRREGRSNGAKAGKLLCPQC